MIVDLFDDLDRDNPFFDLCQAIKLFAGQVGEIGHSLMERKDVTDWTRQELPPFTGYNIGRTATEYRESFERNRDRLRFEFGRFAEPDTELEKLLSHLEFESFPHGFENAQDVFDAERSIEKDMKPAKPIWRKLAVRLDGLIFGFHRGDHNKGDTHTVIVMENQPNAGPNVKFFGVEHRVGFPTWKLLRKLADAREKDNRLSLKELQSIAGEDAHKLIREFNKLGDGYPLIDTPNGKKGHGYALN